jgi:uncharacterized protein YciI
MEDRSQVHERTGDARKGEADMPKWIPFLAIFLSVLAVPAAAQPAAPAAGAAQARKLYAILLAPGPAWKPGKPFREQGLRTHFDYWMGIYRSGSIVAAGPLGNDSGLVLLLAPDLTDAEAVMHADPAVVAGIFQGSVRSYAPPMIGIEALAEVRNGG